MATVVHAAPPPHRGRDNNVFGYITEMSAYAHEHDYGNIDVQVRFPLHAGILDVLRTSISSQQLLRWQDYWVCLYCARHNPTGRLDCESCGALRNWLLG